MVNQIKKFMISLYCLKDPRKPNDIRYIGITSRKLEKRLYSHICKNGLKPETHRSKWLRKILKEDVKPIIELISTHNTWDEACQEEIKIIASLKAQGIKLTNTTEGGGGMLGYKHSKEWIEELKLRGYKPGLGKKYELHACSKPLFQYDLQGNFIKKWASATEIKDKLKFDNSSISKSVRLNKPCYNFQFKLSYLGEKINSEKYRNMDKLRKPILQIDKELNIINYWNSGIDAADQFYNDSTYNSAISRAVQVNAKKPFTSYSYDYIWVSVESFENEIVQEIYKTLKIYYNLRKKLE